MAKEKMADGRDWEHDVAYKLVDLYVKELTERRDKRMLDIEGLVESYLYVLGRLKAGDREMGEIVGAIKQELKEKPETPGESGLEDAIGKRKISNGLLKALESM